MGAPGSMRMPAHHRRSRPCAEETGSIGNETTFGPNRQVAQPPARRVEKGVGDCGRPAEHAEHADSFDAAGKMRLSIRTREPASPQGLASRMMLNGVSVARRKREKPADVTISRNLFSPAWAPSAGPFRASETGTQISEDAP